MAYNHNSKTFSPEPKWGDVNKTDLPDIAFADAKGRKYPHHWVHNDVLYLHKGGLSSAIAAANGARTGQKASAKIRAHLERHKKAIDTQDSSLLAVMDAASGARRIDLYGPIGSWYGTTGEAFVRKMKDDIGENDPVEIHIHSRGGYVYDALLMYNFLRTRHGHVVTVNDGIVASAATLSFLAGDERLATEHSRLMIHLPSISVGGNREKLQKALDQLNMTEEMLIDIYADPTGIPVETIREMLEEETWLSSEESRMLGLSTGKAEYINNESASISMDGFDGIPKDIAASVGSVILNRTAPPVDDDDDAVHKPEDREMTEKEILDALKKVGIDGDTIDAAMAALGTTLKDLNAKATEFAETKAAVDEFLKATGFSDLTEAALKVQAMLPAEEGNAMKDRIATFEAEKLVRTVGKNKVTDAFRPHAINYAKNDPEGFKAWAETAPAIVPDGSETPKDEGETEAGKLPDGTPLPADMTIADYNELKADFGEDAANEAVRALL